MVPTRMTDEEVYTDAALLGVISGLRSFSGIALVSQFAHSGMLPDSGSALAVLKKPISAQSSLVLALGELIADKLPGCPARTKLFPLLGRAILGSLSGGTYAASRNKQVSIGASAGLLAALGSAFAGYYLRRFLTSTVRIPDLPVALAEDALLLLCSRHFVHSLHRNYKLG